MLDLIIYKQDTNLKKQNATREENRGISLAVTVNNGMIASHEAILMLI